MEAAKQRGMDYRNRGASNEEAQAATYYDIEERIAGTGRNIRHVVPPPELPPPQLNEVSFDPVDCAHKGALLYAILNTRQLHVYDTILAAITDSSRSRLFFIDGPGGSGKTYLYNSIFNMLMGQR
ncbi:hypothetical protein ANCDUO_04337 [Ancylostoma duodenale]|uniref:ATP-dependent DNA helicase n=1 Tax=Ancylostoma duodenale TaxID=51022 RepID=A0A0C2H7B3_9BILA|nr:hypothetical protein ANCDUO_04337 [Ancylostoma duodenale]